MTKKTAMTVHAFSCLGSYAFLGYVAVHHLGWLDGIAAWVVLSLVVGAIRTKSTWDDLYPDEKSSPSGGVSKP